MKLIILALHNYEYTHKSLPAHASYSPEGQPLLSWRVHILPFLEEVQSSKLYEEFHLDEPWNSPHNRQLIARMPEVFQCLGFKREDGKTNYLAVVGKDCAFDGSSEGMDIGNIKDGTGNTILLVETDADRAVEWTKPNDLRADPKNPTAGLGNLRPGGWISAWADGHVEFVVNGLDPNLVYALFTCAGKEDLEKLGR